MSISRLKEKPFKQVDVRNNHFFHPVIVDDNLYYVSPNGAVYKDSLFSNYSEPIIEGLKQITFLEYIDSQKALLVIFNKGATLRLYSLSTKEIQFEISVDKEHCFLPNVNSYPVSVDSDFLFISDWNCTHISAYDIKSNDLVWSSEEKHGGSFLVDLGDRILVATNQFYKSGIIEIRAKTTGSILHSSIQCVQPRMNPIEIDDLVIIYCYDHHLISINKNNYTIELLKEFETSDDLWDGSQMKLINGKIIAQNSKFERVSFDLESKKVKFIQPANRGGFVDVFLDSLGEYYFLDY